MLICPHMNKEREQQPSHLSIEVVAERAKETALKEGGHPPTLLVKGTLETVVIQPQEIGATPEDRQQQLFEIGFLVGDSQLVGILQQAFLVTEGWLSVAEAGQPLKVPPSQDPQRKEVLVVSELNVDEVEEAEMNILVYEMLRDTNGELRELTRHNELDQRGNGVSPLLDAFLAGFVEGMMPSAKQ